MPSKVISFAYEEDICFPLSDKKGFDKSDANIKMDTAKKYLSSMDEPLNFNIAFSSLNIDFIITIYINKVRVYKLCLGQFLLVLFDTNDSLLEPSALRGACSVLREVGLMISLPRPSEKLRDPFEEHED